MTSEESDLYFVELKDDVLSNFYRWFMVATWDMEGWDEDIKQQVYLMHLIFAEYTGGYRSKESLHEAILLPMSHLVKMFLGGGYPD